MAIDLKPSSEKYQKKISVVITVYNEQDNIMPLANALYTVLDAQAYDYEIIFVDDGSVDNTYKILRRAQTEICNLTIIRLKKTSVRHPPFLPASPTPQVTISSAWTVICKTIPKIFPNCSKQSRENMMLSVVGGNTAKTLQPNGSFRERSTSFDISSSGTQSMTRVAHSRYSDQRQSNHCYRYGQRCTVASLRCSICEATKLEK